MISSISSPPDIEKYIENILGNVDKYTAFIKEDDHPKKRAEEIKIRMCANLPDTFILCSYKSANRIAKNVLKILNESLNGYKIGIYEDGERFTCLFIKS